MPTAQINARIDKDIKTNGDVAFAAIDCSPTQAIRALWGFASRNRQNKAALRDIIDTLEGKESIENCTMQAEERVKTAERGPCIIKNALREIGATTTSEDLSYDKLLDQAYLDKWEQRGLS